MSQFDPERRFATVIDVVRKVYSIKPV